MSYVGIDSLPFSSLHNVISLLFLSCFQRFFADFKTISHSRLNVYLSCTNGIFVCVNLFTSIAKKYDFFFFKKKEYIWKRYDIHCCNTCEFTHRLDWMEWIESMLYIESSQIEWEKKASNVRKKERHQKICLTRLDQFVYFFNPFRVSHRAVGVNVFLVPLSNLILFWD